MGEGAELKGLGEGSVHGDGEGEAAGASPPQSQGGHSRRIPWTVEGICKKGDLFCSQLAVPPLCSLNREEE